MSTYIETSDVKRSESLCKSCQVDCIVKRAKTAVILRCHRYLKDGKKARRGTQDTDA